MCICNIKLCIHFVHASAHVCVHYCMFVHAKLYMRYIHKHKNC